MRTLTTLYSIVPAKPSTSRDHPPRVKLSGKKKYRPLVKQGAPRSWVPARARPHSHGAGLSIAINASTSTRGRTTAY
jgi:hypothetical protein